MLEALESRGMGALSASVVLSKTPRKHKLGSEQIALKKSRERPIGLLLTDSFGSSSPMSWFLKSVLRWVLLKLAVAVADPVCVDFGH